MRVIWQNKGADKDYKIPGDYTGMETCKGCWAWPCVCGCLCENTHTYTHTRKNTESYECLSIWTKNICARGCMCACIYKLCAWTSGLCTSECWHQIRLFIITAVLIMREDSRDRHRLGKHWSAERHGTYCLLCIQYEPDSHDRENTFLAWCVNG